MRPFPGSPRDRRRRRSTSSFTRLARVDARARPRGWFRIAGGAAFSFSYTETAELLTAAGADVVAVDPLRDEALPPGTSGLVIGGGFPEVYAAELSANAANGSSSDAQRATLGNEFNGLVQEIDRISNSADFNGRKLFDGTLATQVTTLNPAVIDKASATADTFSDPTADNIGLDSYGRTVTVPDMTFASQQLLADGRVELISSLGPAQCSTLLADGTTEDKPARGFIAL